MPIQVCNLTHRLSQLVGSLKTSLRRIGLHSRARHEYLTAERTVNPRPPLLCNQGRSSIRWHGGGCGVMAAIKTSPDPDSFRGETHRDAPQQAIRFAVVDHPSLSPEARTLSVSPLCRDRRAQVPFAPPPGDRRETDVPIRVKYRAAASRWTAIAPSGLVSTGGPRNWRFKL